MARPLPAPTQLRNGSNGHAAGRSAPAATALLHPAPAPVEIAPKPETEDGQELDNLREENAQLRALCVELEQALHEASLTDNAGGEDRLKEYEAMLEQKTEMIRQQHEQLQELQAVVAELQGQPEARASANPGPAPCEDDLLALSEELERDRRQIQEDEQALMQQMREMEVSMARERAEMARQRNDMQRLQSEIRHEIERLERNGALQKKIESLKNKLSDATTRRGSAPAAGQKQAPSAAPEQAPAPSRKESLMGRLFGR